MHLYNLSYLDLSPSFSQKLRDKLSSLFVRCAHLDFSIVLLIIRPMSHDVFVNVFEHGKADHET